MSDFPVGYTYQVDGADGPVSITIDSNTTNRGGAPAGPVPPQDTVEALFDDVLTFYRQTEQGVTRMQVRPYHTSRSVAIQREDAETEARIAEWQRRLALLMRAPASATERG